MLNYPAIYEGFEDKGISNIQPRVNVFTYNAWKAKGRQYQHQREGRGFHQVLASLVFPIGHIKGESNCTGHSFIGELSRQQIDHYSRIDLIREAISDFDMIAGVRFASHFNAPSRSRSDALVHHSKGWQRHTMRFGRSWLS